MVSYGEPNQFGMRSIKPEKVKGIKKGDKRFIWMKGDAIEVEILNTYNHHQGICIAYETKTWSGSTWVDISELYKNRKNCIDFHLNKVKDKHKKELDNIKGKYTIPKQQVMEERR